MLMEANKKIELEVNISKTKYMVTGRGQTKEDGFSNNQANNKIGRTCSAYEREESRVHDFYG